MKKRNQMAYSAVTAMLAAAALASSVYAAGWRQDGAGWRYQKEDGSDAGNEWIDVSGRWYRMGENGLMHAGWYQDNAGGGYWYYLNPENGGMETGWVQTNGKWYFLDTCSGGPRGAMLLGWQQIDGRWYYLDPADGGALATNRTVEGGYAVNVSGAWVKADGSIAEESGKGIPSVITDANVNVRAAGGAASGGSSYGAGNGGSYGSSYKGGASSGSTDEEDDADGSVSGSANDFRTGNWGQMTASQRDEVTDAIEGFISSRGLDGKSDLEKEIAIIGWLVENCSYKGSKGWENATAYSCIIGGEAQCAGYADAFLQTAKACSLEARYVYNKSHAWNLVKLDGEWYHVDVTWEDPGSSNKYGEGNLKNAYINLKDSEVRKLRSHKEWSPSTQKANGSTYRETVLEYYLLSGQVDKEMKGDKWRRYLMSSSALWEKGGDYSLYNAGYRLDDGSNYFGNADTAEEEASRYIEACFSESDAAVLTFPEGQDVSWLTAARLKEDYGSGAKFVFKAKKYTQNGKKIRVYAIKKSA